MLDRHAAAASARIAAAAPGAEAGAQDEQDERCRRGVFSMDFLPLSKVYASRFPDPDRPPLPATAGIEQQLSNNPFFFKTKFDSGPLLAAALVSQLASLLGAQYDRQNALRLPSEPAIDIPTALAATIRRAGLSASQCAALASALATVGAARDEGLKASLREAREVQIENLRRQHEHQDKIRAELRRRETEKVMLEQQRRAKIEREKKEKAKARREALVGDIPVPQA